MPETPPAHAIRIRVFQQYGPSHFGNGFWLQAADASLPNVTDMNLLCEHFHGAWNDNFVNLMSEAYSLVEVIGTWFDGVGGEVQGAFAVVQNGGDSGTILPVASTLVLGWRDGRSYRGGHPRSYLSGLVEDRLENPSTWSAGTLSDYQTAANAFLAAVNAISGGPWPSVSLGDVSFRSGGLPVDPGVFYPYGSVVARAFVGAQRRRTRSVGP